MKPTYHVSSQVNAQDGDRPQWKRDVENNEKQERCDLRNVAGQCVGNGLL